MGTNCFFAKNFFKIIVFIAASTLGVTGKPHDDEKKPQKRQKWAIPDIRIKKNKILKANFIQYRHYLAFESSDMVLFKEVIVKPIDYITVQKQINILNKDNNVEKINIKSARNLSLEVFSLPKIKTVEQSSFAEYKSNIICLWEIINNNEVRQPICGFYALRATAIYNLTANWIYAPLATTLDASVFNNPNLKGIIVRPDFPIEAIPKEKHSLIQIYLPEELLMIYSLSLQILHEFNDLIQYCNYDTCPQDVDPLRWCSYQKCLQTIKLAMEKKNPPISSFFDIL